MVGEDSGKKDWTPQKLAPGQTCRIHVEVAADHYAAQAIAKFVTVTSNDRARPTVNLQLHGQVWLPIEVSPPPPFSVSWPAPPLPPPRSLRIFNRMERPLTLSDPQSATNAFSAVLKTNLPGQEFELAVTAASLPISRPFSARP